MSAERWGQKTAIFLKKIRNNYNDLCVVGWAETAILHDFQQEDYALRNAVQ